MNPNTPFRKKALATTATDSGLTESNTPLTYTDSQSTLSNSPNRLERGTVHVRSDRLETSLLGRDDVFFPPHVVPTSPEETPQNQSANQGPSISVDKGTTIKGPDILVTPIPGAQDFSANPESSQPTFPLPSQPTDGVINKGQVVEGPEILVTPIPDTESYDDEVIEGGGTAAVNSTNLSHLRKGGYIDKLITPIPGTELQQDFVVEDSRRSDWSDLRILPNSGQETAETLTKGEVIQGPDILITPIPDILNLQNDITPIQETPEDFSVMGQIQILSPSSNQNVFDLEHEINWAPSKFDQNKSNNISYTVKFWGEDTLTKSSQTIGRTQPFLTINTGENVSLGGLLNDSSFTPGSRYALQVLHYFNKQLLATSATISFFYTPLLSGPVFLQTQLIPIQLVIRDEKDRVSGKVFKVYYFFRNGKWFRILDPKRMHPKDPKGIDLREGIKDQNFTSAPPEVSAELNQELFPPGWEKAWQQFDEASRVQLQILAQLGLKLQGVDPETIALIQTVRKDLEEGKSADSIWETHKTKILLIILGLVAAAAVGAIVGKLFRLIFRRKWLKALTHVEEATDTIIIRVDDSLKAIKDVRKGLDGAIAGQVKKDAGKLYCPPAIVTVINTSGKKGAATDMFLEWFKILKAYAKKKGLKEVHIVRTASSDDGVKFLKRLGFKPTSSNTHLKGLGDWELTLPVK